jgi:hypothetical protein
MKNLLQVAYGLKNRYHYQRLPRCALLTQRRGYFQHNIGREWLKFYSFMALETLKITESGLKYYVLEKVPPQLGKSRENSVFTWFFGRF